MALLTSVLLLLFSSSLVAETSVNLLNNGDFEGGLEANSWQPVGWGYDGWGPRRIALVDSPDRPGAKAAQITSNGSSWHFIRQAVDVEPGKSYRLRLSCKTDGKVGGKVQIHGFRPGADSIWGEGYWVLADGVLVLPRWQEYTFEFTAPDIPDAKKKVVILLGTSAWREAGTSVYYDDLVLEPIDAPAKRAGAVPVGSASGNMVLNGGFEFGLNSWKPAGAFSFLEGGVRVDSRDPHEGRFCLALENTITRSLSEADVVFPKHAGEVFSNWSYAEPGHTYHLTVALKGSVQGQKASFSLIVNRPYDPGQVRPTVKQVQLTTEWQVFTLEQFIPKDIPLNKLIVMVAGERGKKYWLDSVRLTYDRPADDSVIADDSVGVAVELGKFPPVYDYGKPASIDLEARNAGPTARKITVEYELQDLLGKVHNEGRFGADLAAGTSENRVVEVDTRLRGRFELFTRVLDERGRLIREKKTPFVVMKPVAPNADSPIGINNNSATRMQTQSLTQCFGLIGGYGYSWARHFFAWRLAEPDDNGPEGEFDWREFDRQLAAAPENVLGILDIHWEPRGGSWRTEDFYDGYDNRDFTRWLRFVRATVSRYKDRVHLWEILNEPSLYPAKNLKWYNALVKATYLAIKEIDPQSHVIACGPGDSGQLRYSNSNVYVEEFLKNGGVKYCDVIGLHPYAGIGSPIWADLQGTLDTIRSWAKQTGGNQEVIMTEAGNYTAMGGYWSDTTCMTQASRQAQCWLLAWANRTQLYQHDAMPFFNGRRSCYDPAMIPNAVFCAANALAELFNESEYDSCKWLEMPDSLAGVYGFQFTHGDEQIMALWSEGTPERRRLVLSLAPDRVSAAGVQGNPARVERHEGKPLITVTPNLTYVKLAGLSPKEAVRVLAGTVELSDVETGVAATVGAVQAGEIHAAGYTPPPAGPFYPDKDGFICDWLVMGPFANPGQRGHSAGFAYDFLEPIGGEASVRLRPGMSVFYEFPTGREEWTPPPPRREVKAVELHSGSSAIDLSKSMSPTDYVVAYAYCHVTVPKAVKAHLRVGSDDGIRVWVNGTEAINRRVYRGAAPDQDTAEVNLRTGQNRVMVKVDTDQGGWNFYLRFVDANGKVLQDLNVSW